MVPFPKGPVAGGAAKAVVPHSMVAAVITASEVFLNISIPWLQTGGA